MASNEKNPTKEIRFNSCCSNSCNPIIVARRVGKNLMHERTRMSMRSNLQHFYYISETGVALSTHVDTLTWTADHRVNILNIRSSSLFTAPWLGYDDLVPRQSSNELLYHAAVTPTACCPCRWRTRCSAYNGLAKIIMHKVIELYLIHSQQFDFKHACYRFHYSFGKMHLLSL